MLVLQSNKCLYSKNYLKTIYLNKNDYSYLDNILYFLYALVIILSTLNNE